MWHFNEYFYSPSQFSRRLSFIHILKKLLLCLFYNFFFLEIVSEIQFIVFLLLFHFTTPKKKVRNVSIKFQMDHERERHLRTMGWISYSTFLWFLHKMMYSFICHGRKKDKSEWKKDFHSFLRWFGIERVKVWYGFIQCVPHTFQLARKKRQW